MESGKEIIQVMPEDMIINLTAPTQSAAYAINDDPDWLKVRILLGALFRRHGTFLIEVIQKGKVFVGHGL